jgi:hypothetical protein
MSAKTAAKRKPPEDVVEFFFDVEQRSPEWHELRRALPTASKFATIMASGKDGGESVGRRKLLYQLAGEKLTGEIAETFRNDATDRGLAMEAEARDFYGRTRFADLATIGFVKRTVRNPLGSEFVAGCSPDSFVGKDGILEIKTTRPDLMIEMALKGAAGFPSEHRQQCQGSLWVTGRSWVDLLVFYRGMPIAPCFRIERDESYIARIAAEVERFDWELRKLIEQIRNMTK